MCGHWLNFLLPCAGEVITSQQKKMLYKTYCATCIGIDVVTVTVEVDVSIGVGLHLVGMPDQAVKESILRVTTAITSYGFRIPGRKIVVNLAPADIRKEGSAFDLSIAVGLIAAGKEDLPRLGDFILMGELALDGSLRPVPGALPVAIHAASEGFRGCIFHADMAMEAADIEDVAVFGVNKLSDVIDILSAENPETVECYRVRPVRKTFSSKVVYGNDFKNVRGQQHAKRGLEIAAAGGHNLLLTGSPGSGKTLMASCLPSILPPMTREESLETSKIYSIAGCGWKGDGLMVERPFRTPHHSSSLVSLIGGGSNAMPGEISLAHNGVLYLDEIVQFNKSVLDALRQPLEDGHVTISRVRYKVRYPSSFMLIASMNPCPCGYAGDGSGRCTCSRTQIDNYASRLSGPMADRMDMTVFVRSVSGDDLVKEGEAQCSESIAARVIAARKIQLERFRDAGIFTNSQMTAQMLGRYCAQGDEEKEFLRMMVKRLGLSARAYSRVLKLSRTIADLEGAEKIELHHLSEAIQFRTPDRGGFND